MTRKKVWERVESRSASYYDFDMLDDVIKDLQNIAKRYPGARINTSDEHGYQVMGIEIERDETDTEMKKREHLEAGRTAQRRAQYEALKKEFEAGGNESK